MAHEPRLRIGLLTPAFAGATGVDSGIGAHFRHLADALCAAGHDVTVALVTEREPTAIETRYPVRTASPRSSPLASVAGRVNWQFHQWLCNRHAMRRANELCRMIEADIWETTSTGALARDFLRLSGRSPVVTRISTTAAQLRSTNAGARTWIQRRLEAWESDVVQRSDRIVTHSASHRDHVAVQFGLEPAQIALVPHGIPVPPRTAPRERNSEFNILFVGRMEQRKGIDLLLAALPAVLQEVPAATATLVGSDRDAFWETRWLRTAPPAVASRVTFVGVVADRALEQHYANAHVFVAPSRYESFGLIFVEAMARALPVVALRAPGAADLIADNMTGVLVPPDNANALAAALVRLAKDSAARNRIGSAAHALVEGRYSLPVLAAASADLYRDVMRSRRTPRA